jgi:hypothetical protein
MTPEEAIEVAMSQDLGRESSQAKVERGLARGVDDHGGWNESLKSIEAIHGKEKVQTLLEEMKETMNDAHDFNEESETCARCGIRMNDPRATLPCFERFNTSELLDALESFKDASQAEHQPLLLAAIHRLEVLEKIEEHLEHVPRSVSDLVDLAVFAKRSR